MTYQDCVNKYGPIANGVWTDESKWCVVYKPPQWFVNQVVNTVTGFPCVHIYLNKDMVDPLDKVLALLYSKGLHTELKTFDGCVNQRDVRGDPGKPSTHSYGLGLDLDAHDNQLGTSGSFSQEFLQCWKDCGFDVGAWFHSRKDPMHFSLAWEH